MPALCHFSDDVQSEPGKSPRAVNKPQVDDDWIEETALRRLV